MHFPIEPALLWHYAEANKYREQGSHVEFLIISLRQALFVLMGRMGDISLCSSAKTNKYLHAVNFRATL